MEDQSPYLSMLAHRLPSGTNCFTKQDGLHFVLSMGGEQHVPCTAWSFESYQFLKPCMAFDESHRMYSTSALTTALSAEWHEVKLWSGPCSRLPLHTCKTRLSNTMILHVGRFLVAWGRHEWWVFLQSASLDSFFLCLFLTDHHLQFLNLFLYVCVKLEF